MKPLAVLACTCALFAIHTLAEETPPPVEKSREEMTRLQVFLDSKNFGPGKIDGRMGEFTRKSLERYRQAQGQNTGQPADRKEPPAGENKDDESKMPDVSDLPLDSVAQVFTEYTVSKEDTDKIGEIPEEPKAQAKLEYLSYETVVEAVAEKFHTDLDYFKELNPQISGDLKAGDVVKVPNVQPFELAAVSDLKPGSASPAELKGGNASAKPAKKEGAPAGEESDGPSSDLKIRVDVSAKMLEVRQADKIVATFPVTPGSDSIATPKGEWKVKGVANMPDFRYDEQMLKKGERSEDAYVLPPGPNNPVGVVWIELNKKGIGIHGTNEPDTIGRSASHGCIRLANWDIVELARMVKGGVPVTVE